MNTSVYAKPVIPRIVVRPALATLAIHGLLLVLLTVNWDFGERETLKIKPVPKVINATLVDASQLKPKPKPKPKPITKPEPIAKPQPKVVEKPKPKPVPKSRAADKPKPVAEPKPKPKAEPRPEPRMTAADLAALARAELSESVSAEEQAAAATAAEMSASYQALIAETVIGYWSRPPSARNGMEVLLQLQLIPTGEIVSVSILQGSGNSAFDRSAQNAVEKAGAFPELQNLPSAEFERNFRRFRLLFRPEDLRY